MFFYWPTAKVPVGMPHALLKTPTSWRVVNVTRGATTLSTTTNGTTTLTSSALFGKVEIGDVITGTGITAGTYVAAKASDSSLTMSAVATDSTTNNRTFSGPPGSVYAPLTYDTTASSSMTDSVYNLSKNYIVLACKTAGTWAEIEVS